MATNNHFDAVVVGSGPNGLAAAITLAEHNLKVLLLETASEVGGGARSAALTFPDVTHDICSSVFPLVNAPFFKSLPLHQFGVKPIHSPVVMAHPFDDGSCTVLNTVDETISRFDHVDDRKKYRKIMSSFTSRLDLLASAVLAPIGVRSQLHHPMLMASFGKYAVHSGEGFIKHFFRGEKAKALFIGIANHSMAPLNSPFTAAIAMILILYGHDYGWPIVQGGAKNLSCALLNYFKSKGGCVRTNFNVGSMKDIPPSKVILFDVTPKQILQIMDHRLPLIYRKQLEKFRYGIGVFKIDWTLDKPVPFKSIDCRNAATVHIGGSSEEIISSERQAWKNIAPHKPFILLVQPSPFDKSRAPQGKHPVWGYCHVPLNCKFDMTQRIESQVERFAPGFRHSIIKRHVMFPSDMEAHNPNNVGGNIMGGLQDWRQFFTRPHIWFRSPYLVPMKGVYLCSASTPPGGGVHGMCGYYAALAALKYTLKIKPKVSYGT